MTSDRTYQVFTVKPDGTSAQQLTWGGRNKCDPAMSPKRDLVAFSHGTRISVASTSGDPGSELEVAKVPDNEHVRTPTWSPDGLTIAFMRSVGHDGGTGPAPLNEIWAVTRATLGGTWSPPALLTGASVDAVSPAFSPDGTKLVMSVRGSAEGERDLHVMDLQSKALTRLTSMPGSETMPSWHPTQPGRVLFTTCSRGVYTVTLGSSAPPQKMGNLSVCDVTWESSTGQRVITHTGGTLSVYDIATARSTVVDRRATDRQPDW